MANKKAKSMVDKTEYCPKDLNDHIFYGLELDEEQKVFRDAIWSDDIDIVFCDARAGTGKTLVSIATALLLYEHKNYNGIVYVTSPTQEEKLGYLPGNKDDKISPYTNPIKKALIKLNYVPDTMIANENIQNVKEGACIECVSHNYLRGDNFDDKIIIIDEAQNMYLDELKKTLTRVNSTCKTIVIGHSGQCDLFKNKIRSGFSFYREWFKDKPRAAVCELNTNHRGWVANHADDLDTVALTEYLNRMTDDSVIDLRQFMIK